MDVASVKLTVFFENPFWVGIFERIVDGKLSVCKVTFGAEPRDCEVWNFILKYYANLPFSPAVQTELKQITDNAKRRQRNIKRQMQGFVMGTKSQQALAMQHEEIKTIRRQASKEQKEAEKQRQFDLKQQKRKEKQKGH